MKWIICFLISINVLAQEELLSTKFESGIPEDWTVQSDLESRIWQAKEFNGVTYVQMSAYSGREKPPYKVKAEIITPLLQVENKVCKLKFAFADAYQNGQPIRILIYDENLKLQRELPTTAWKDLVNNSVKYDNVYESTDWIELPQINKPYRISFMYDSQFESKKKLISTIIQLAELDVWCQEN